MASRSLLGILMRQLSQTYFDEPVRTYIFDPQAQCAKPAKRCRVRRAAGFLLAFPAFTMLAHSSQRSSGTIASTSV